MKIFLIYSLRILLQSEYAYYIIEGMTGNGTGLKYIQIHVICQDWKFWIGFIRLNCSDGQFSGIKVRKDIFKEIKRKKKKRKIKKKRNKRN